MNPKRLLEQHGINPKKSLGQNFLHDPNALEKIVTTAELMPEDTVLEIGPGTGALTAHLAPYVHEVISVEVDERMRPVLEQQLAPYPNVEVIYEDILALNVVGMMGDRDFVVVANVPYYITSAILKHLLDAPRRPRRLVLTVQHELAERVVAKPGDLNLLAVSVQFYGRPRIVSKLNPAVFWPRPEVDSALLRIDVYDQPAVAVPSTALFFKVVKAGFSQKRKQLKNALSGGLQIKAREAGELLDRANLDSTRRAETLSLEEWAALTEVYAAG